MPNYQNGKIYTIRCKTDNNLIYVGSTTQTLAQRLGQHKSKSHKDSRNLYKIINNQWEFWYIELYEECPCENKEQLCKKEGEVIREIGTLNHVINGRTQKEYYHDNFEKISLRNKEYAMKNEVKTKEYKKIYRQNNTEKIALEQKEYLEKNAEKIKEYKKMYHSKKKSNLIIKEDE